MKVEIGSSATLPIGPYFFCHTAGLPLFITPDFICHYTICFYYQGRGVQKKKWRITSSGGKHTCTFRERWHLASIFWHRLPWPPEAGLAGGAFAFKRERHLTTCNDVEGAREKWIQGRLGFGWLHTAGNAGITLLHGREEHGVRAFEHAFRETRGSCT